MIIMGKEKEKEDKKKDKEKSEKKDKDKSDKKDKDKSDKKDKDKSDKKDKDKKKDKEKSDKKDKDKSDKKDKDKDKSDKKKDKDEDMPDQEWKIVISKNLDNIIGAYEQIVNKFKDVDNYILRDSKSREEFIEKVNKMMEGLPETSQNVFSAFLNSV